MGFWDKILKTEQSIRKHLEGAFGHGTAHTPLEVRRFFLSGKMPHLFPCKV